MTIIALDFVAKRIGTLDGTPGSGAGDGSGPVLTSLIYPIEVIEGLDASTSVVRGWMQDPVDHIDVASDLVSGALTATIEYETESADPEAIDVDSDLASGVLTTVIEYEAFDADVEAIDVSSAVQAGALVVAINYVTHTDPATDEGLDVASYLVSGSLT